MNENAQRLMEGAFKNAYYIGRVQIFPVESGEPPHRIYYIGYSDIFGSAAPIKGGWSFQIWGEAWVTGRSKKLDRAIIAAMKGKFPEVRHNLRVRKRAIEHGEVFTKPQRSSERPQETATKTKENPLPIRGRKRRRRKLNI